MAGTEIIQGSAERGNQSSEWDMAERKLVVYLNKGITATLNYASFWRPQDILGKSGLYQILGKKTDSKADPGKMLITLGNARKGKHWMISPWRTLTLVHAIQQPLDPPQITSLQASRKENETTASLKTTLSVHGRSTDKVSIDAFWKEHMDDFADNGPKISNKSAHVISIPVDYFNQRIYGNAAATSNEPEKKEVWLSTNLVTPGTAGSITNRLRPAVTANILQAC
ncbi:MAG: hypothetical protein IPP73_11195 [Chitinophagaceae bacterium]|nr:hypothetical protein [Chitinophagaceae bacterium]